MFFTGPFSLMSRQMIVTVHGSYVREPMHFTRISLMSRQMIVTVHGSYVREPMHFTRNGQGAV